MFQSSLSNQYTHLYNEISRLDDKSVAANSRESSPDNEASLLSAQIKNFIKARIALVGHSMDNFTFCDQLVVYLCFFIT